MDTFLPVLENILDYVKAGAKLALNISIGNPVGIGSSVIDFTQAGSSTIDLSSDMSSADPAVVDPSAVDTTAVDTTTVAVPTDGLPLENADAAGGAEIDLTDPANADNAEPAAEASEGSSGSSK